VIQLKFCLDYPAPSSLVHGLSRCALLYVSNSTLLTRVIVTVHVHQKPNTRRVIRQIYCPSERKRHTVASESGQSHANVGAFWSSVTTTPGIVIYQVDVGINVKCRSIVYTKIYSEYSSTEYLLSSIPYRSTEFSGGLLR
jgi:hypothetical protein